MRGGYPSAAIRARHNSVSVVGNSWIYLVFGVGNDVPLDL
jgi:hypothetical protein